MSMDDKRLYCVICASCRKKEDGKIVLNNLFICHRCNNDIIEFHLLTNVIKWLCPHCRGASGSNCLYCDLRIMIRKAKTPK